MTRLLIATGLFLILIGMNPVHAQEIEKKETTVRQSTTYGSYGTMDDYHGSKGTDI